MERKYERKPSAEEIFRKLPYNISGYNKFVAKDGLPAIAPPWGTLTAIDLNTGVLTDISGLEANGDQLVATRPIYEGKVLEKTISSGKPVMATIRGRAFPKPEADASKTGTATNVDVKAEALTEVAGYSAS